MEIVIFSIFTFAIAFTLCQCTANFCFDSRHIESQKSKRLNRYLWKDFQGVSVIRCAHLCFIDHKSNCRSFNYKKTTRFCELNSHKISSQTRDVPSTFLVTNSDFRYYQSKWFSQEFFDGYEHSKTPHCLDQGPCGSGISFYGRTCYEVRQDKLLTYTDASLECKRKHGQLAMFPITLQREVMSQAMGDAQMYGQYFIGLADSDGDDVWHWVDNTPAAPRGQVYWMPGQPDNTATALCIMDALSL